MSKNKLSVTTPTDTQILLERAFDAPRALVWRTLTEPELVRQWWGCGHGEVTLCELDVRVGGKWHVVMRMPGNQDMGMHGEYVEIAKPERLVNTEGMDGQEGSILVTYTLAEANGKTTLKSLSECHTKELRDIILGSGMESGAASGYDRMEELARAML